MLFCLIPLQVVRKVCLRLHLVQPASFLFNFFFGLQTGNGRNPFRLGLGDGGVSFDLGHTWFPNRFQVTLFVGHVTDGQRKDVQTHGREVGPGCFFDRLGEVGPLEINVFYRERAEDGAQMPFYYLQGHPPDRFRAGGKELLGGGDDSVVVAPYFDLSDGVDHDLHALGRIRLRGADFYRV